MQTRIRSKINEFQEYVKRWDSGEISKWDFNPEIELGPGEKLSIFDPIVNEKLFINGYSEELYLFYVNKYKRDEFTIRFHFAPVIETFWFPTNQIILTDIPLIRAPETKKRPFFTVLPDNCYFPTPRNNGVIFCDSSNLPQLLIDRKKLLIFISFIISIRQMLLDHIHVLTWLHIIDKIVPHAIPVPLSNLYAIFLVKQHDTFKAHHEWIIELFNQNLNKMGLPVFIRQNTELLKQDVTVNTILELKNSLVEKIHRDIKISSRLNRNIGHINYDWQYIFYAFLKDLLVESQQEHPYNQKGVNKVFIKDVEDKNWDELVTLAQEINKWYRMNS
jgi:hypothetical protein